MQLDRALQPRRLVVAEDPRLPLVRSLEALLAADMACLLVLVLEDRCPNYAPSRIALLLNLSHSQLNRPAE